MQLEFCYILKSMLEISKLNDFFYDHDGGDDELMCKIGVAR